MQPCNTKDSLKLLYSQTWFTRLWLLMISLNCFFDVYNVYVLVCMYTFVNLCPITIFLQWLRYNMMYNHSTLEKEQFKEII